MSEVLKIKLKRALSKYEQVAKKGASRKGKQNNE